MAPKIGPAIKKDVHAKKVESLNEKKGENVMDPLDFFLANNILDTPLLNSNSVTHKNSCP